MKDGSSFQQVTHCLTFLRRAQTLPALTTLDLNTNRLSGSFPPAAFLSDNQPVQIWPKLRRLDLSFNELSSLDRLQLATLVRVLPF
jgi:Leucine-rich repeat (LRR) protein